MKDNNKSLDEVLKEIDNVKLLSKEDLADMDFYELSYYMQILNTIDSLGDLTEVK